VNDFYTYAAAEASYDHVRSLAPEFNLNSTEQSNITFTMLEVCFKCANNVHT